MTRTLSFIVQFALLAIGYSDVNYDKQKYQVVMPRPKSHNSGDSKMEIGAAELSSIAEASAAAGEETRNIVEAQFLSRLPALDQFAAGESKLKVTFVHKLPSWHGLSSWEPIRNRKEDYSLRIVDADENRAITIDAKSSWALANAMATLYQLLEVKAIGKKVQATVPGCPHHIEDVPAYPHRGLLLDVARTYYPVAWLKDLISRLSEFKLNVLHLHLTDTSSWPLEVEGHPELTEHLSYKDINRKDMTYSRSEVRDLVEFARLRGVSLLPEVDGPAHAPALGYIDDLKLTVAANAEFSTGDFAVEPPAGTWNYSNSSVTSLLNDVFRQLANDFTTTPYLHVGGDEPRASSLCEALTDEAVKKQCLKECTKVHGGNPYAANCATLAQKPKDASGTYWFPDVLNAKIQKYFNDIVPEDLAKIPLAAWSGVRADMGVTLPNTSTEFRHALQLWEFPKSSTTPGITFGDCGMYELIQSSATHPQKGGKDVGWLYLECGEGQNWISMGENYWCSRASWVTMYSQNLTQHYEPNMARPECQRAFIGAEIAIWGEITGTGNTMSLIFPRAVAFAERAWTNPRALNWDDLTSAGIPPAWYWEDHLKGALGRLNTVVENLEMRGGGVSRLQPKFCFDHPAYCANYTNDFLGPAQHAQKLPILEI